MVSALRPVAFVSMIEMEKSLLQNLKLYIG